MERRLGRIQASHPQVSDLYDVALRETREGVRLQSSLKEDRKLWHSLREGAYMYAPICRRHSRRTVVTLHAADTGRGVVPRPEKRALDSAVVSPTGVTRESPRAGWLPWLRPL